MKFDYPYTVSRDEARQRLEIFGEYLKNRHGIDPTWDGDSASFTGRYLMITINGKLRIEDQMVYFEGSDPGMLLRKKAINYLRGKLASYLDPNTPIDALPRHK